MTRWTLGAALLLAAGPLAADEPLRPPARHTECSRSGAFCATSDPEAGTAVHAAGEPDAPQWSVPRWFRVLYVSDDGEVLVTGYDGMNLVPAEEPEATEVLAFWRRDGKIAAYTLGDLDYGRGRLRPTVSHFHWGSYEGFDADGDFRMRMVDGVVLVFDVETGSLMRRIGPAARRDALDPRRPRPRGGLPEPALGPFRLRPGIVFTERTFAEAP